MSHNNNVQLVHYYNKTVNRSCTIQLWLVSQWDYSSFTCGGVAKVDKFAILNIRTMNNDLDIYCSCCTFNWATIDSLIDEFVVLELEFSNQNEHLQNFNFFFYSSVTIIS